MEKLTIRQETKQLDASEADLTGSTFHKCMLNNWGLNDIAMRNCKIILNKGL